MHQPPARYPLHSNNSFLREISTAGGDRFFVALAALWCCIACIPLLLLQSQALEMEGMVMEQGIRERGRLRLGMRGKIKEDYYFCFTFILCSELLMHSPCETFPLISVGHIAFGNASLL